MAYLSRKTHTWVRWTFGLCLVGLFSAHALDADQVRVLLLLRAFSFDQNLKKRVSDAVNLAILYRVVDATSEATADNWMRSFRAVASGVTVQAIPFKVEKLAFETGPKLRSAVEARHISILLVCDSLEADLGAIREISHSMKLLTVAGNESLLAQGLTVGVSVEQGQGVIKVNRVAAGREDVQFGPDLMRIAKFVNPSAAAAPPTTPPSAPVASRSDPVPIEASTSIPAGPVEFNERTMTAPAKVSGPDPEYTQRALDREVQGQMVVRCIVSTQGAVRGCRVLKGLPFMNDAVVVALEKRIYRPALLSGTPVEVFYTFKVTLSRPR